MVDQNINENDKFLRQEIIAVSKNAGRFPQVEA